MTPQEQRMRAWASRGGGLRTLQELDAALQSYDQGHDPSAGMAPDEEELPPAPPPAPSPRAVAPAQAADDEAPPRPAQPLPPPDEGPPGSYQPLMYADAILSGLSGRKKFDPRQWQAIRDQYTNAADTDAGSRSSALARRRMGPMLAQLGLKPSEINMLSASDISAMSQGGNLVKGVAEARQKARAEQARIAAEDARRSANSAEFDRRAELTGNTAGGKRERAEILSGMARERAQEQAYLQNRLALGRDAVNERQRQDAEIRADERRRATEERADARRRAEEERKLSRTEEARARKLAADQESKLVTEEALLDKIEKKLKARLQAGSPDDALPGRGNIVSRGAIAARKEIFGGTGMDADDTLLMTDLDALGLQTYSNTAHNAPNAVREQELSQQFYGADGTLGGALKAVQERKRMIADTKKRLKAAISKGSAPSAGVPAEDPDEGDLGVTYDE